jgi:hypothetical protein
MNRSRSNYRDLLVIGSGCGSSTRSVDGEKRHLRLGDILDRLCDTENIRAFLRRL